MIALLVTISRGHQGNVCIVDETSRTPQFVLWSTLTKKPKGSWSKRFVGTQILDWLIVRCFCSIDLPCLAATWPVWSFQSLRLQEDSGKNRRWLHVELPTMFFCFVSNDILTKSYLGRPHPQPPHSQMNSAAAPCCWEVALAALGLPRRWNRWNRWFHQQDIPFFIKRWERSLQDSFLRPLQVPHPLRDPAYPAVQMWILNNFGLCPEMSVLPKKRMINRSVLFRGCLIPILPDPFKINKLYIDLHWLSMISTVFTYNISPITDLTPLSWEYMGIPISLDGWPTLIDKHKTFSVVYSNVHVLGNSQCRDGSKHIIIRFRGMLAFINQLFTYL